MPNFVFSDFSRTFFLYSIFEHEHRNCSKGNETKTCVNKSFDVMITKYTLRVLLAFTV